MINKKELIKGIITILSFYYVSLIVVLLLKYVFNFNIDAYNMTHLVIVDTVCSASTLIIALVLYFDLIKRGLKKLKDEYKKNIFFQYLSNVIVCFIIMLTVNIFISYIEQIVRSIFSIKESVVNNQQIIEKMLGSAPAVMIISACIIAPLSEELIFRGAIGQVIKNKKVFIPVSGFIFGLMHVTDSVLLIFEILLLGVIICIIFSSKKSEHEKIKLSVISLVAVLCMFGIIYYYEYGNLITKITSLDLNEVVGSISYVGSGLFLASLYVYFDNILINIGVHSLSNTIAIISILLLK